MGESRVGKFSIRDVLRMVKLPLTKCRTRQALRRPPAPSSQETILIAVCRNAGQHLVTRAGFAPSRVRCAARSYGVLSSAHGLGSGPPKYRRLLPWDGVSGL